MNFLTDINNVIDSLQKLRYDCHCLAVAFATTGHDKASDKLFTISSDLSKQINNLATIRDKKVETDLNDAQIMNKTVISAMLTQKPFDS